MLKSMTALGAVFVAALAVRRSPLRNARPSNGPSAAFRSVDALPSTRSMAKPPATAR